MFDSTAHNQDLQVAENAESLRWLGPMRYHVCSVGAFCRMSCQDIRVECLESAKNHCLEHVEPTFVTQLPQLPPRCGELPCISKLGLII